LIPVKIRLRILHYLPCRVIETVRKEEKGQFYQPSLFEEFKRPLREAIEFYKHKENRK
jgi:hypothetical protein